MVQEYSDWGRAIEDLARRTLGEPNSRLSNPLRGDLRYGSRGSLSVKVPPHSRAGSWYDFEAGVGGGFVQLATYLRGDPASLAPRPAVPHSPARNVNSGYATGLWNRACPVPLSPEHPARRWLAARNLWRPELPAPGFLRWLPGEWPGGGRILVLASSPGEWIASWPSLPAVKALQRIPVDDAGRPAGIKKSLGSMSGTALVIGPPCPSPGSPVFVCEGVADGLALSSRYTATVVVVFGIAAMQSAARNGLADYLAQFGGGVEIWADRDQPSRGSAGSLRSPAGGRAAGALKRAVEAQGGVAAKCHAGGGYKDPADWAAAAGFLSLDREALATAAVGIVEENPQWPRWQVARVASCLAVGGTG